MLRDDATRTYDNYAWMLNEESADPARRGLARELARMNLTLNTYTQWYWKATSTTCSASSPCAPTRTPSGRSAPTPKPCSRPSKPGSPPPTTRFQDYRLGAATLSAAMLTVVRRMLAGEHVDQPGSKSLQARVDRTDGHARPGLTTVLLRS